VFVLASKAAKKKLNIRDELQVALTEVPTEFVDYFKSSKGIVVKAEAQNTMTKLSKDAGCTADLKTTLKSFKEITMPSTDEATRGCAMSAIARAAEALTPIFEKIAFIEVSASPVWLKDNKDAVSTLKNDLKSCVNILLGKQISQYWKKLSVATSVLCDSLRKRTFGDSLILKLLSYFQDPILHSSLTLLSENGLARIMMPEARALNEKHIAGLARIRSDYETFIKRAKGFSADEVDVMGLSIDRGKDGAASSLSDTLLRTLYAVLTPAGDILPVPGRHISEFAVVQLDQRVVDDVKTSIQGLSTEFGLLSCMKLEAMIIANFAELSEQLVLALNKNKGSGVGGLLFNGYIYILCVFHCYY